MREIFAGQTDVSIDLQFTDLDGTAAPSVNHDAAGLQLHYRRGPLGTIQNVAPVALALLSTAHADGGVEPISNGQSRCDFPDAAFAAGVDFVEAWATLTDTSIVAVKQTIMLIGPRQGVLYFGVLAAVGVNTFDLTAGHGLGNEVIERADVFVLPSFFGGSGTGARQFEEIVNRSGDQFTIGNNWGTQPTGAAVVIVAKAGTSAAALAAVATRVQTEMEEDGASLLDTVADRLGTPVGASVVADIATRAAEATVNARLMTAASKAVHDALAGEVVAVTIGAGAHTTTNVLASDGANLRLKGRLGTFMAGSSIAGRQIKATSDANGSGAFSYTGTDGAAIAVAPAENDVVRFH